MRSHLKIQSKKRFSLWIFFYWSLIISASYGVIEYLIRLNTEDAQAFIPLIIRACFSGISIGLSVGIIEKLLRVSFTKMKFISLVLIRSLFYTIVISFWLSIVNVIWEMISSNSTFTEGLMDYLTDESYALNLVIAFVALILIVGLLQIDSLHRRGELLKFILGTYHTPKEAQRIFCFIDLKGSTSIAERLGHLNFSMFLKDYYSDITDAISATDAEIYQYVGDEIVLSWSYENGLKDNKAVQCFFLMKEIIHNLKEQYINKYDVYPEFKAALHGGKVVVTWVGELKKEIVYIGDVLNTTARIQEECKRLSKDFLISGHLLNEIENLESIKALFIDEITPRGKEEKIKLYSLEID